MKIKPCRTYHAVLAERALIRMPDEGSAFKVYHLSIVGRDDPSRYEWSRAPISCQDFRAAFLQGGRRGIGFVTAFPHVTKVFRFCPDNETLLDVEELETRGLRPLDCSRGDGFHEFACLAEAAIASDEYAFWARSATVQDYLSAWSEQTDFPFLNNRKLFDHFE